VAQRSARYWKIFKAHFPAVADSLEHNFNGLPIAATVIECAFKDVGDDAHANATNESRAENIMHKLVEKRPTLARLNKTGHIKRRLIKNRSGKPPLRQYRALRDKLSLYTFGCDLWKSRIPALQRHLTSAYNPGTISRKRLQEDQRASLHVASEVRENQRRGKDKFELNDIAMQDLVQAHDLTATDALRPEKRKDALKRRALSMNVAALKKKILSTCPRIKSKDFKGVKKTALAGLLATIWMRLENGQEVATEDLLGTSAATAAPAAAQK